MRGHCKKHHGCHGWDGRTLRDAPRGCRVRIQGFSCCPKDRCRLLALGLTPGVTAEISPSGCLRVRDADIVLGDDLAATITVQPLPEDARA
jgi:ferrous iron transport protein A